MLNVTAAKPRIGFSVRPRRGDLGALVIFTTMIFALLESISALYRTKQAFVLSDLQLLVGKLADINYILPTKLLYKWQLISN
ncbi:hypothetical protein R50072_28130 [Simiduia litorea]